MKQNFPNNLNVSVKLYNLFLFSRPLAKQTRNHTIYYLPLLGVLEKVSSNMRSAKLRSACASEHSDKTLRCPYKTITDPWPFTKSERSNEIELMRRRFSHYWALITKDPFSLDAAANKSPIFFIYLLVFFSHGLMYCFLKEVMAETVKHSIVDWKISIEKYA